MNNNEWNNTWTEQNAKAEMIGSAFAVGCIGIPAVIIVLILMVVAFTGME